MFELKTQANGDKILVYVGPRPDTTRRGVWALIGHENEKNIEKCISVNRQSGLQVEKDADGYYRVLVLQD